MAAHADCVSPCWKEGLVYQQAASRFTPGEPAAPYALDLYRSERTPAKEAPVLVLLHGGGFVTGTRAELVGEASVMARAGFLVASIDYRMVPAAQTTGVGIASPPQLMPASAQAQDDTVRALQFIRARATPFGATRNRRRYAVGGFSAGAITSLRVAFRAGDAGAPKGLRWHVGAAISMSGAECGDWTALYDCTPAYSSGDAPVLMFHGESDSIVPFSWAEQTCEAAVDAGSRCRLYPYAGQDHFWPQPVLTGTDPRLTAASPGVLPTAARWLRRTLPRR